MKHALIATAALIASASLAAGAAELTPAQVFKAASPSVVVVFATDVKGQDLKQGSGVAIGRDLVVSNCHVITTTGAAGVEIEFQGKRYPATNEKGDLDLDLCTLRAPRLRAPPANVGRSDASEIGE